MISTKIFNKKNSKVTLLTGLLFLVSFLLRLIFIFKLSDPNYPGTGLYDDSFPHWEIAQTSKESGFAESNLKLTGISYDPYFWSIIHPLFTILAFTISGSSDIYVMRMMTALMGSLNVLIIFLLCKRYWSIKVAASAAIFAAINPVGIFNESSGAQEPIAIFFLLISLYFWPKRPSFTGISLALALMTRGEDWIISTLMIGAITTTSKVKFREKFILIISYFLPVGIYMIYLHKYTGNYIYPVYKNFIVNAIREGMYPGTPGTYFTKIVFILVFIAGLVSAYLSIKRKPKVYYLEFLGSLYCLSLGAVFGLSKYSQSVSPQIWYSRYVDFLYILGGICFALLLFSSRSPLRNRPASRIFFVIFLAASLFIWFPIRNIYLENQSDNDRYTKAVKKTSGLYSGGKIVITQDLLIGPSLYAFHKFAKIPLTNIVSDMSDPYFTMTEDPNVNWSAYARLFLHWLNEKDIKTIITYKKYSGRYARLAQSMPHVISGPSLLPDSDLVVFEIKPISSF